MPTMIHSGDESSMIEILDKRERIYEKKIKIDTSRHCMLIDCAKLDHQSGTGDPNPANTSSPSSQGSLATNNANIYVPTI
jgi:hypothetical protein